MHIPYDQDETPEQAKARKAYIVACRAAFYAWRDVMLECDDPQGLLTPDDVAERYTTSSWCDWRNMIVSINMDELDKWFRLAEQIGWDATMTLAAQ